MPGQNDDIFRKFADFISRKVGTSYAFIFAALLILTWIATGPIFNFSNRWQLVINTVTTIVTFLMVFIIQNTQSRNDKAMQLKLDELVRAIKGARDSFVDIENINDDELEKLHLEFQILHEKYTKEILKRKSK